MMINSTKTISKLVLNKNTDAQKRNYSTYTAQLRKQRIREQIAEKDEEGKDILSYPNESLGNNYELNKKFIQHGILNREGQAYHNLHLEHLVMLDNHALDKDKAIVVDESPVEALQGFYSSKTRIEGSMMENTSELQFERCQAFAEKFLSEFSWSERFFMNDGALGTHAPCRNNVRFITNDATMSIYVKQLLDSVSPNFNKFTPETIIYHSPDVTFPGVDGPAVLFVLHKGEDIMELLTAEHLEQLSQEERDAALNTHRIQIILAGVKSFEHVKQALLSSSSFFHTKAGAAAVNASTAVIDGKSVLLVNDTDLFSTGVLSDKLFSQDYSTLLVDGTVRTLNGVHFRQGSNMKVNKGDLLIGKTYHQSINGITKTIVAPKPSAIFNIKYNYKGTTGTAKKPSLDANVLTKSSIISFQSDSEQKALWDEISQGIPVFETTLKRANELESEIQKVLSQLKQ